MQTPSLARMVIAHIDPTLNDDRRCGPQELPHVRAGLRLSHVRVDQLLVLTEALQCAHLPPVAGALQVDVEPRPAPLAVPPVLDDLHPRMLVRAF
jgi:hypothetical protein